MSSLNEIRDMKKIVQEAARRKQESDRISEGVHIRDSIKSICNRKKEVRRRTGPESILNIPSWHTICLALAVAANLFLAFRLIHSVLYPGFERSHLYARHEDFKKAERFVNSYLDGNISDVNYFNPQKARELWKSAPVQLAGYEGIPAARVEVSDRADDDAITYKATCVRGKEAAIIYMTPDGSSFNISGIKIDGEYAMNNPEPGK
ncbi:MAG: hypothetical protein WAX69_15245 [Victivallales bacterium]